MGWKQDLHRLKQSFGRQGASDYIGVSVHFVDHYTKETSDSIPDESKKWKVREAMERLRAEHQVADEVVLYALQQAEQLRNADSMDEIEDILDRTVPMLRYKAEGLLEEDDP